MKNIFNECDIVFLSYDEPGKDERFKELKRLLPQAERVDGVKGLDFAHRTCAQIGSKGRVLIIDGDNSLLKNRYAISDELLRSKYIFSLLSQNSVNNLTYGNGGIKCWPREFLKSCQSHELKEEDVRSDFVFDLPYYQLNGVLSVTEIHHSKAQAFRAGFREGIKTALVNGQIIPRKRLESERLEDHLSATGLYRLKTWLQVGRDITHGRFAMLGTRQALSFLYCEERGDENILLKINDYDWLLKQTKLAENLSFDQLEQELTVYLEKIAPLFRGSLQEYNESQSKLYKSAMVYPCDEGPIKPSREFFRE